MSNIQVLKTQYFSIATWFAKMMMSKHLNMFKRKDLIGHM